MSMAGWEREASPFHEGELAIQEKLGVRDRIDRQGRRMIRDYLTCQHRQFFSQLPYVVVGGIDHSERIWTSMLTGQPGFLSTPDEKTLRVNGLLLPDDPLTQTIRVGADVGFLGIELSTRRRNRINGVVSRILSGDIEGGFEVRVKQSFGNCPQYIQSREVELEATRHLDLPTEAFSMTKPLDESVHAFETLSAEDCALISGADTFFIATAYQSEKAGLASGVDVSHRGGKPGFVRVDKGTDGKNNVITVPDFSGNNHFNTFGNILLNPRAGLLFLSFERGDFLYLSGWAEVIWEGPELAAYEGAERLLRFYVECGYRVSGRLRLRWSAPEFSPFLEGTGVWS
ncbi:MAG: pyridoxamine 5'-phosphate oxidase family protein [Cyanobacteria bacterium J06621_11]